MDRLSPPDSDPSPPEVGRELDRAEIDVLLRRSSGREHGCRLVDVRGDGRTPPVDHRPGVAWVPLERPGRVAPVFLMPPRGKALVALGPPDRAASVARALTAAGWPCSWNAEEPGPGTLRPGSPTAALWDVDPLLRAALGELDPRRGPVLDLGSGSSREGVFLAQRGFDVLAVDRLPDALELASARARHHGVTLRTLDRKLTRAEDLPAGPFGTLLCFRFLPRPLLGSLSDVVESGGALVLRSYGRTEGDLPLPRGARRGPRRRRERVSAQEIQALLGSSWDYRSGPREEVHDGAYWCALIARRGVPERHIFAR